MRDNVRAFAVVAVSITLSLVGTADARAQECNGEDETWCTACSPCNPNPTRTNATPHCVEWYEGAEHDGLVLGYFSGCVEYLPCEEMIPCTWPIGEENTAEEIALLARALRTTEGVARQYITKYPGLIAYDSNRDAVQILGCKGAVKAHLPMPRTTVAEGHATRFRAALNFVATLFTRARSFAVAIV